MEGFPGKQPSLTCSKLLLVSLYFVSNQEKNFTAKQALLPCSLKPLQERTKKQVNTQMAPIFSEKLLNDSQNNHKSMKIGPATDMYSSNGDSSQFLMSVQFRNMNIQSMLGLEYFLAVVTIVVEVSREVNTFNVIPDIGLE